MDHIGIIGARKYRDKKSVETLITSLPKGIIIVTSGCDGVCTWTWQKAKELKIEVLIFKPDLSNIRAWFEVPKIYYQRNRELIQKCDFVHAFISEEAGYTGGTRFETEYAAKIGKPVKLHWEKGEPEIIYQYKLPFEEPLNIHSDRWQNFFETTIA
jgi:hypothetical protein